MKKLTLTLLASAAIAMPALVPAMAQNNTPQQPDATQQQQSSQPQANQSSGQQGQQQANQNPANQNNGQQDQRQDQQADNQPIPPQQLGRSGVKQVQQALDKHGFDAGRADGVFGRETRSAVKDFQKAKGMPVSGQIDQQTLSDLGVNVATNDNTQNSNQGDNNNQDGNTNPVPQPHGQ